MQWCFEIFLNNVNSCPSHIFFFHYLDNQKKKIQFYIFTRAALDWRFSGWLAVINFKQLVDLLHVYSSKPYNS